MLRLGGVASSTYLVAFPAIKKHFQQHGLELDWVLYSKSAHMRFVHSRGDLVLVLTSHLIDCGRDLWVVI
jgi:hypothetical protein